MKEEKKFVCRLCKMVVDREKRIEHLIKNHNPLEFFSYETIITDEWEILKKKGE